MVSKTVTYDLLLTKNALTFKIKVQKKKTIVYR